MKKLDSVTLLGVDCVDINRLILVSDICQKNFEFTEVKLLTSITSIEHPNIVPIKNIGSVEEYSKFIITELDQYVNTSHVLIFQHDGFILNPNAWTDDFLNYDYIGAPWLTKDWSISDYGFPKDSLGKYIVGNGGFSLRSKKLTSLLTQMYKDKEISNYHPEDVVISVHKRKELEARGIIYAPINLAKKFSYEGEDKINRKWNGQFGFHGLTWTDISDWLKENPEYSISNSLE